MNQTSDKDQLTNFMFRIHQIQIRQFTFDSSPEHQALGASQSYTFEIKANILIDPEMKIIGIEFNVKMFADTTKTDKICELTVLMSFHIINFDEVVNMVDKEYDIPDQFIHHLIGLTLSTTRGILFEKLQGSFLSQVILPIFDVPGLKKIERDKS